MEPNIVFFLIDGLRADVCFDENKTCCTPNLDSLKKNSVSFTQAYSSADGTFTSLNSLFSGHFPFRTGVRAQRILLKKNNFIEIFTKKGYEINGLVPNLTSFRQLINYFKNNDNTFKVGTLIESLSTGLTNKIIDFLKSKTSKTPWLYYVHLFDLHPIKEKNTLPGIEDFNSKKFGASLYERAVSYIDHELGKIFECVDFDNTVLVLTSDHGERIPYGNVRDVDLEPKLESVAKFGKKLLPESTHEAGGQFLSKVRSSVGRQKSNKINKDLTYFQKRSRDTHFTLSLFDEMLHIPLFFANNSINSRVIPNLIRNVDIFPTLCELVKINFEQQTHGRSLVPIIQGGKFEEKPVYLHTMPYQKPHPTDSVGLRTSKYKYFRSAHNPKDNIHLYDLKNDPCENNNIAETNEKLVTQFENTLMEIQNDNFSPYDDEENPEELKKIENELKKMGYL